MTMPTTPGSVSHSPATMTSAKLWRQTAVHRGTTRPALSVSSPEWCVRCADETKDLAATYWCKEATSTARTWDNGNSGKEDQDCQAWRQCHGACALPWQGDDRCVQSARRHCWGIQQWSLQAGDKVCFSSCLEQNINNINQFRHVKHAFLCRKGMLSKPSLGTSFSHTEGNILAAEKIPSPDQAISVREDLRLHSLKPASRSHTRWGCRIVWDRHSPENISRSALTENKLRNDLIKTIVNVCVIHLLILVVFHSDGIEDRYLIWPLSHFPQQLHLIYSTYYITDLIDYFLVKGAP